MEEEKKVFQRLIFNTERRFAVDLQHIKQAMAAITNDAREGWKNGIPSDDAVCALSERSIEK